MLQQARQYFDIELVDQKICCRPIVKDFQGNLAALKVLETLKRHRLNTRFLLAKENESDNPTAIVAVDIETTALHHSAGDIRLVSVFGEQVQMVTEKVAEVAHLLEDPSVLKVFHNAAFDVTWLTAKGYSVVNYTDTMVMGQILQNTAKSNNTLQALAFTHLGVVLDKTLQDESNWQNELTEQHKQYALKDAEVTFQLYECLKAAIADKHLDVVLHREIAALPALIELSLNGLLFDYDGWSKVLDQLEAEAKDLSQEIPELLGAAELNLNSPKQLIDSLAKDGIVLQSTTDETLAKHEDDHPAIYLLRKYKKIKKQLSTYGEKLQSKIFSDGRLHGQWRLIGTDTSRMTCKQPNLQGLPSIAKPYVKAPPGKCLVIADYSTIELRILAEITQDQELVAAFQQNEDLHAKTARAIFDKTPNDSVTSDERKIGKVINFGLIYGMTPYGLRRKVQAATGQAISLEEAHMFRNKYFELYPGVLRYQDAMLKASYISTLGGRYWSDETAPLSKGAISRFNYPIQGTGAEGLKESLKFLMLHMPPSWKLIAAVHDEIVLEVPEEDGSEAERVLVQSMKQGMQQLISSVPIEIESEVATQWIK